jgi:membrane protein YqaA with SNARE-associated domain
VSNTVNNSKQPETEKRGGLREKLTPLLTLLLVIAIVAGFYFYGRNPERIAGLKNYGYLGAFLISLIGNGTVLLPVFVLPILCAIGVFLFPATGIAGPIIVGLVGGAGAGIGEITGYMLGYSGRGVIKNRKIYLRLVEWMKKWGALVIFINALIPFFFDVAGIAAGALRLPLWKFVLACWLGRTINYVTIVLLVAVWGWQAILRFFS